MNKKIDNIFILNGHRSPITKKGGWLSDVNPVSMIGALISTQVDINPSNISGIIIGQCFQDKLNIAKQIYDYNYEALTINSGCTSGLEAIKIAIERILLSDYDSNIYIAGGVENMSSYIDNNPDILKWNGSKMLDQCDEYAKYSGISKKDCDLYAALSYRKYYKSGLKIDDVHQHCSYVDLEPIHPINPHGVCTVGNSSNIADGAAIVVIASGSAIDIEKDNPIAKVIAYDSGTYDNTFTACADSIKNALVKAELSIDDIDLMEINEGFAAQMIGTIRKLGLSDNYDFIENKINVYGGSIAMGHPLGASGARIMVTLLNGLVLRKNVKYALASIAGAGGQATTIILENMRR